MSAKNRFPIDIDNRESKKSVVQRFMTSESEVMPEPPKTPEPAEIKQPEEYNVPKRKKNEEEISESEIEETVSEKTKKPMKGEKTQDDVPAPEQKEKLNPFVSAKPRESASKKESRENSQNIEPKNDERYLPSVGENFTPVRTPPQKKTQAAGTIKPAQEKDIGTEAVEEPAESEIESESPAAIYEYESEPLDVTSQSEKDMENEKEVGGEREEENGIEQILEAESVDENDSNAEPSIAVDADVSGMIFETQDKIDELTKKVLQNNTNHVTDIHKENSKKTEQIFSKTVINKVMRRAYDHDDQSIAHYVEVLEKNDIKSRFYFKNTVEDAVVEEVNATLKHIKDMCKCDRCFSDVCAITLNALKPHYVTTAMGELYDRVHFSDVEKLMEISAEVFKAVDYVKNNPSHK